MYITKFVTDRCVSSTWRKHDLKKLSLLVFTESWLVKESPAKAKFTLEKSHVRLHHDWSSEQHQLRPNHACQGAVIMVMLEASSRRWLDMDDTRSASQGILVPELGPGGVSPSRCQRCLSRLVPRSAETPLVKGTVIFTWKIFGSWRHCLNTRRFQQKLASVFLDVWTKKRHTVWNNSYLQYRKRRLLKQRLLVYLHRCASRCARVWLWRHVYSLRGSSWWMWLLFEICILLLQWIIDTGIYVHGTGNNILRLNVHNAFHIVFLIILLLDYKEFEFAWRVFKK